MDNHIHINSVSSTNSYLKEMTENCCLEKRRECFPPYFAVTADSQQQGRGRRGKCWESEAGKNLLLSVLLYPQIHPSLQFRVCRQVSVAVAKCLEDTFSVEKVSVKWPNDIYIKDKKTAGILIEHFLREDYIHYSIVGIGININQTSFSSALPNPTSICLETGKTYSPNDCCEKIINQIKQTENDTAESLEEQYLHYLYKYNVFSDYVLPKIAKQPLRLKITGVDAVGRLQLTDEKHHLFSCAFDEVIYCFDK
ncbi:MAG: biotin--[acetyl-CoA-carboxylase] ligase [Bacteroidales bacterium]|jgi:BirA family biotin operon repressor/biotin-[acetyl-CoA-carboxylase] ligase|nr:biotin--[acetyl-CoA-carboxylase] ligase [Bacteroidales bacterium]